LTSARAGDGFPWAWLYFRALDCGMSAADFWQSSPRAVIALYNCAKQARTPAATGTAAPDAAATATPAQPPAGVRLSRLPR